MSAGNIVQQIDVPFIAGAKGGRVPLSESARRLHAISPSALLSIARLHQIF